MKKILILLLLCFAVVGWSAEFSYNASSPNASTTASSNCNYVNYEGCFFQTKTGQSCSATVTIINLLPNTEYTITGSDDGFAYAEGSFSFGGTSYSFDGSLGTRIYPTCVKTSSASGTISIDITTNLTNYYYTLSLVSGVSAETPPPPEGVPPRFDPNPVSASGTTGENFSGSYSVVEGDSPITYTSSLPAFLSGTNSISGVIDSTVDFSFTVTATNEFGSDTLTVNVAVTEAPPTCVPPVITSSTSISCSAGETLSYTASATGTAPIEYDFTYFPTFLACSSGSPSISGVIPQGQTTFSFGVIATNACGSDSKTVTVTINPSGGEGDPIHVIVDNFSDLNNVAILQDIKNSVDDVKLEIMGTNTRLDLIQDTLNDIHTNTQDSSWILGDINDILTQIQASLVLSEVTNPELTGSDFTLPDNTARTAETPAEISQITTLKNHLNNTLGTPGGDWYFEFPLSWTGFWTENPKILLSSKLVGMISYARDLEKVVVWVMGLFWWWEIVKGAFVI